MMIKIFVLLLLFTSCSQTSVTTNNEDQSTKDENTVEAASGSSDSTDSEGTSENQKTDEFIPHTIKANRNKTITVFIGKLEDRMFYAIGVMKWFERHGYKIKKVQTTSSEEDQLFSTLNTKKKTSYIEWQLHQCCKDEFPLRDENSYKEVMKNLETKVLLSDYAQDRNGCLDYSNEHDQDHVLCIISDKKSKVEIGTLASDMNLIVVSLQAVNYQEQLSLVDYIDQGYSLARTIKN